jgi:hypothetical protein
MVPAAIGESKLFAGGRDGMSFLRDHRVFRSCAWLMTPRSFAEQWKLVAESSGKQKGLSTFEQPFPFGVTYFSIYPIDERNFQSRVEISRRRVPGSFRQRCLYGL